MASYQNGKVYRIISPNVDKVYIGSTTRSLDRRFQEHESAINNPKKPCTSSLVIKAGNASIQLIEAFPCASKKELERREGDIQRTTVNCCNKAIAGEKTEAEQAQSIKDYYIATTPARVQKNKEFYEANKEEFALKNKKYYEEHTAERALYNKEWYMNNCDAVAAKSKVNRDKNRDKINEQKRQSYHKKKAEAAALAQNITP